VVVCGAVHARGVDLDAVLVVIGGVVLFAVGVGV
jgi:hypothetical protein